MPNWGSFAILDNGANHRLFVKSYRKDVEAEYTKAQQFYAISLKSKCFMTPRPLYMVPEHRLIIWEYVPGLVNLRAFLLNSKGLKAVEAKPYAKVLRACGKALAVIHSCLEFDVPRCPQRLSIQYIDRWPNVHQHVTTVLQHSPMRHLHGDFSCANIFLLSTPDYGNPQVVIVDVSPNRFMYDGAPVNVFGEIYLDLALFIASLNSKPSFYFRLRWDIQLFAREFLRGYEEIAQFAFDRATVFACAAEILQKYGKYQKNRVGSHSLGNWWQWRYRKWRATRLLMTALTEMETG